MPDAGGHGGNLARPLCLRFDFSVDAPKRFGYVGCASPLRMAHIGQHP